MVKMETTRSVATAIQPKDWAVYWIFGMRISTSRCFRIISVSFVSLMRGTLDNQRFLRFSHEGKVYQIEALPFGLASAR
jgi:hypothetical protein